MARFNSPNIQYFDNSGNVLDGGLLEFFGTGTSGESGRLDTFKDVNLNTENTNPVVLSAAGRTGNIFLQAQSYKVTLRDKDEVLIFESDPVSGDIAEGNFSPWNSLTFYNEPDFVVASDGRFYQSITDGNVGNDPAAPSISNWLEISFISTWNPNETFYLGQIAKGSDNLLYSSTIADNLGNDPVSDAVSWKDATSGDIPGAVLAAGRVTAFKIF